VYNIQFKSRTRYVALMYHLPFYLVCSLIERVSFWSYDNIKPDLIFIATKEVK